MREKGFGLLVFGVAGAAMAMLPQGPALLAEIGVLKLLYLGLYVLGTFLLLHVFRGTSYDVWDTLVHGDCTETTEAGRLAGSVIVAAVIIGLALVLGK